MNVYQIDYYWQDGYSHWRREIAQVIAENEEHAQQIAERQFEMPYGVNGVEYVGPADTELDAAWIKQQEELYAEGLRDLYAV